MKRTLIAAVLTLGLASSAWGASLQLNLTELNGQVAAPTDQIAPGDSFTLELVANIVGDEPITLGLDVRLIGGGAVDWTSASQTALTSGSGFATWSTFPTLCTGGDPCIAVNQGNPLLPNGAPADAFSGVLATILGTATAGAAGQISLEIVGDFFGLSGNGGVAPIQIVPEPTTVALLGLGLFGLSVAGRRR